MNKQSAVMFWLNQIKYESVWYLFSCNIQATKLMGSTLVEDMKIFILWVDLSFCFVPNDFCVYEYGVSLHMWNSFCNIGMGGTICECERLQYDQWRLLFSPLICCIVGISIGWSLDQDKPFYPYAFYAHSDPCLQRAFENLQWCLNLMSAFILVLNIFID